MQTGQGSTRLNVLDGLRRLGQHSEELYHKLDNIVGRLETRPEVAQSIDKVATPQDALAILAHILINMENCLKVSAAIEQLVGGDSVKAHISNYDLPERMPPMKEYRRGDY